MMTQFTDAYIRRRQKRMASVAMRCKGTGSRWIIKKHVVTRNINHLLTHRLVHKGGYADFRRHLPSSLVIWWLAFIRDQNCLCVVCCTPGIESTWIKIFITVTPREHQPVPCQIIKKHQNFALLVRCLEEPLFTNGFPHKGSIIRKTFPWCDVSCRVLFNTLRPRQNGRYFPDDIFKCIFFNENVWIPIQISLTFVPKGPINNIPALVRIMAWRRPGNNPLFGPMVARLPTHICVTRPQWVNPMFISVFPCDVSDWLWTDWEPMSRVHVEMGSVMSSYYHRHNGCRCSDVGYTPSHQQSLSDSNISSVFGTQCIYVQVYRKNVQQKQISWCQALSNRHAN